MKRSSCSSTLLFTCSVTIFSFALPGHVCTQAAELDTAALIQIAQRHKLPSPPDGARLVLAHTRSWSMLGNSSTSRDPAIYSPAFLIEEETNGSIVVFRGTQREDLDSRREPLWRPFSTVKVKPKAGGYAVSFDRQSAFICVVQLALRGDQSTAQQLWQRVATSEYSSDAHDFGNLARQLKDPPFLLAQCLFSYLRSQVLEQPQSWSETHARMSALLQEFPALKNSENNKIFSDLGAAIGAGSPAPGSIEALLLDWSRRPGKHRDGPFREQTEREADVPARKIILQGAAAVPELITLLDDRRITVHELPAMMMARARIRSVGELAGLLLQEITGVETPTRWDKADPALFRKWLEQVQEDGEGPTLVASAFIRAEGKITGIKEGPVRLLAEKFPEKLEGLCREFSKEATPQAQPYSLADAIATSRLPREQRVRILAKFAQQGSLEHKRCVLQSLATFDQSTCAHLLLPLLEQMPVDASGPYWTCPEAAFTHVVMLIEDDETWRKYLQVAKRSSVGLRMEMMNPLCNSYIGTTNRARRIGFAAAFLDDASVRRLSERRGEVQRSFRCIYNSDHYGG